MFNDTYVIWQINYLKFPIFFSLETKWISKEDLYIFNLIKFIN